MFPALFNTALVLHSIRTLSNVLYDCMYTYRHSGLTEQELAYNSTIWFLTWSIFFTLLTSFAVINCFRIRPVWLGLLYLTQILFWYWSISFGTSSSSGDGMDGLFSLLIFPLLMLMAAIGYVVHKPIGRIALLTPWLFCELWLSLGRLW